MRPYLKATQDLTLPEVTELYKRENRATIKIHLQIIKLSLEGKTCYQIAQIVDYHVKWVREIVKRYNKDGIDGIADKREQNGGHRFLLNEDERKELSHVLTDEKPEDGGLWTGPKVTRWIERKIGKKIHIGTGWDYLQHLGFSLRIPRPTNKKADPVKQEDFKKNSLRK